MKHITFFVSAALVLVVPGAVFATSSHELENQVKVDITGANFMAADDFQPIAGIFDDATSIVIHPSCRHGQTIPNTIFTIFPSENAEVSSSPANLVTATVSDGGSLSFQWNELIASSASGGGVRIGLPTGQLIALSLGGVYTAQILDGFTSLKNIQVSGVSNLKATFTSSEASAINLDVTGVSTVNMVSNVKVRTPEIAGSSTARVETPECEVVNVSGTAKLFVKGNIGGGIVSGTGQVTVTGDITGTLHTGGVATVNAASCGSVNVAFPSKCNSDPQSVTVDVSEEAQTRSGVHRCGEIQRWSGGMFASSPSLATAFVAGTVVVAALLGM